MAKEKKKFRSEADLARLLQQCGFSGLTDTEAIKRGDEALPFRRQDAGNLLRMAIAIEGINRKLGELLKRFPA